MTFFICTTCAVQFDDRDRPPESCPVCSDPRQYVPDTGQRWTTLDELRREHSNDIAPQGELIGIGPRGRVGIGQRALLVPWGETNLLWDCVALLDEQTAVEIERRGGVGGIAISHPHYYSTMVEWAHRFDCPIHLSSADAEWIMRPDPAIRLWEGDRLDLGHGVSLLRLGGHFPGSSVLVQENGSDGRGTLLSGDLPLATPDRRWVSFMWSYPNMIPLPAHEVRRIADALTEISFETLHSAFWGEPVTDASAVVARSARRYVAALETVGATG
ncbi:MBL fold metallo-hydrolase [Williamsia phyllosphaerae]|uniref:Metallo-beta-lactamase domain-containing protein n=1 Tax=Williamsia phyllosphaerae TaxID=885042 RepID=A0ABQ1UNF9_9NOCA|nr:MBL fold metallo-hydrolase [Williamsia phyllosphaerae]GGF21269.1 hypothetical protein GCM10007298_16470 [Williamsia phyllosphaerae]